MSERLSPQRQATFPAIDFLTRTDEANEATPVKTVKNV
jgi:hypothetical protein